MITWNKPDHEESAVMRNMDRQRLGRRVRAQSIKNRLPVHTHKWGTVTVFIPAWRHRLALRQSKEALRRAMIERVMTVMPTHGSVN